MAQRGIVKNGLSADIAAEHHAALFSTMYGKSGICSGFNELACTKVDNNTVRLASGVYSLSGYALMVDPGTTEDLTIDSGTSGQNRNDLVVAEFVRNGGGLGVDTLHFTVVKGTSTSGTAADPALTQWDINASGVTRQEALYRVKVIGSEIAGVEKIADTIPDIFLLNYRKAPVTYLYGREIPFSWAEIKAKCKIGDFAGIHVGDWKPLTLTTSETAIMEVAGIDTYYGYASNGKHNIDFISRDCLSATYQYNSTNTNIGGWLSSALYTAMNGTGGIYDRLPSDVKAVIGPKLMLLENKAAADSTTWAWHTENKLWLPAELEVFGYQSWSEIGYGSGNFKQYPLFAGSEKHIIKGAGNGGSATNWWELSPRRASTARFCFVASSGHADNSNAGAAFRIPLCFRVS